jgi:MFS family permease
MAANRDSAVAPARPSVSAGLNPSSLIRKWEVLAAGFAFTFVSTFGQTPFIAPFGGALRQELDLSHAAFGMVYSGATLASGILIGRVGSLIDTVPLRRYAVLVVLGLGLACLTMAVVRHVVLLALSLFLLRLLGHGLMDHVAVTVMARSFREARGRAIAVASMGHPIGEAVLPLAAVLVVGVLGWRLGWALAAVVCFLAARPLAALLRGAANDHPSVPPAAFASLAFLRRAEMLLALPALTATAFISTGILFHQVAVAEAKGWPLYLFPSGMAVFATAHVGSTLGCGWLVDRLGAGRPALVHLLPVTLACVLLAAFDSPLVLFLFLALAGIGSGAIATITAPLLAEVYGVERIGAIRATTRSATIVASSLAPAILGILLDGGISLDVLVLGLGLVAAAAMLLLNASGLGHRPRLGAG